MTTAELEEVRTYGGWRERRGLGLMGLTGRGTVGAFGSLIVLLILVSLWPPVLLLAAPLLLALAGLAMGRYRGEPVLDVLTRRIAWHRAARAGWTAHRAGLAAVPTAARGQLPGPLAPAVLLDLVDGHGRPWGVVWNRRSGRLTATLRVAAASTWLVPAEQGDAWVSNWHGWLAKLGYSPAVSHVAVTVDTSPAPPESLAAAVRPLIAPDAPPTARHIIHDVLASAPAAAAEVSTRVAVTFDARRLTTPPDSVEEAAAEFSRLLDGLAVSLSGCGVAVLGRATGAETAGWVRAAFDPAAADAVAAAATAGLTWADARPVAADEHRDRYLHDSGCSVSWAWDEAPRQAVPADVLGRLLAPGRHRKRVTIIYTPTPAAEAARQLHNEAQSATIRAQVKRRTGRDESARDAADRERAARAAAEEAAGAGLVDMAMYVTVTALHEDQMASACAEAEHAAEASRIRLRRLYGSQAVGFAAGLSCGVHPALLRAGR